LQEDWLLKRYKIELNLNKMIKIELKISLEMGSLEEVYIHRYQIKSLKPSMVELTMEIKKLEDFIE
jgi:hypothetical protein